MSMNRRDFLSLAAAAGGVAGLPRMGHAQTPGVSASEIRIGQTLPLSGPAAAYAVGALVFKGYLQMINDRGGINGRKVTVLQLDDGYSPPKTVEVTRKLVEQEEVLLMAATTGTPTSLSVRAYMNQKKVPQIFVGSGAATWADDIQKYPWSLGFQPLFSDEGRETAAYVLRQKPGAKIAVCYQNDDAGKDFLRGLKAGLNAAFMKDPADPAWAADKGMEEWKAFMEKYNPTQPRDNLATYGTLQAQALVQVLTQCGNDLSRENIIRQTANLDLELLLPGLRVKTSAAERHPVRGVRFQQFDGKGWKVLL